jgi:hypothetical protein
MNSKDELKEFENYEEFKKNFDFIPKMVDILEGLKSVDNNKNIAQKLTLQLIEYKEKSINLLNSLEGTDLNEKQQQELYEKYSNELSEKENNILKYKNFEIFK